MVEFTLAVAAQERAEKVKQNEELMEAALKRALEDFMKQACRDVFAGGIAKGHDPGEVLSSIVSGKKYGRIECAPLAVDRAMQTEYKRGFFGIGKKSVVITINTFNNPAFGTFWNAGDTNVTAGFLEHEAGHTFKHLFGKKSTTIEDDVLPSGRPDPAAQTRNSQRLQGCKN
jgi:hypothetical protein